MKKRLEEVRLLESRKSARLADQDTDFARLADVGSDRKRTASHSIDVPLPAGSRKRRPSYSNPDEEDDSQMDECNAALVLMSLSCSPHSPNVNNGFQYMSTSPDSTLSSSPSYRSTPSPTPPRQCSPQPLNLSDEGIVMDYYQDDLPRKKKNARRIVFQCTWPNCHKITSSCESIEAHVRNEHLKDHILHAGEEEFYYTEVELSVINSNNSNHHHSPKIASSALNTSTYLNGFNSNKHMSNNNNNLHNMSHHISHNNPPPTLSHRDMARPSHEDPDYQRHLVGTIRQSLLSGGAGSIPQSPHKLLKLSPTVAFYHHNQNAGLVPKMPISPRRVRGENKKCRKVYGMEHRDQWCTQCKWKKACSRFGDP